MKAGDTVRVYPHGNESVAAPATVVMISENQRSIALGFGDPPGFVVSGGGAAFHPEHGMMMLARREELNGKPWGPWVEVFAQGHFEIEE